MSISFSALRLLTCSAAEVDRLTTASLEAAVIPDDIGAASRVDGFVHWSDDLPTVMHYEDMVLLRFGRATKTVAPETLDKAVREKVRQGLHYVENLEGDTYDELLRQTGQKVSSFPVFIDRASGFILMGSMAAAQVHACRIQLQAIAPALGLEEFHGYRVADTMCAWLEGSRSLPSGLRLGDRIDLRNPADNSVTSQRKQTLPNDDVLVQLSDRSRYVAKLGLYWGSHLSFVLEDPLGLASIRTSKDMRGDLLSAGNRARSEKESLLAQTAIWLRELRPLLAMMRGQFESPEVADAASAPSVSDHFLFKEAAA
jgi:DNA recombination-dependent growth factor C